MILIDIPQIAYKTMAIEYRIVKDDGTRDFFAEREAEESLEKVLTDYKYSIEHDHVK